MIVWKQVHNNKCEKNIPCPNNNADDTKTMECRIIIYASYIHTHMHVHTRAYIHHYTSYIIHTTVHTTATPNIST